MSQFVYNNNDCMVHSERCCFYFFVSALFLWMVFFIFFKKNATTLTALKYIASSIVQCFTWPHLRWIFTYFFFLLSLLCAASLLFHIWRTQKTNTFESHLSFGFFFSLSLSVIFDIIRASRVWLRIFWLKWATGYHTSYRADLLCYCACNQYANGLHVEWTWRLWKNWNN